MKICVCGAQVPFTRGGAEMHMDNLVAAFRAAGHEAELVRLPVAWEQERLFDAALAWRLIPMDCDLVVATNFPSYFVRHPRKVVWLFHQHRGAYDAADSAWSGFGLDDGSLETQRLLSDWDTRALEEATHLFTTSETVADRVRRYNGLTATALYHPPPLADRLRPGPIGDEVFCPSRAAANKRPELLIQAMAQVATAGVRGVLTGHGALHGELVEAAAGLPVDVLGAIDDAALIERYARALAVLYAPFDEDYGYVTLQAFLAGKPVITAKDSGGVLEFVEDGVTGLVTDGSPAEIATAIDRLAADRDLAAKMGQAGRERVEGLDWPSVVERLIAT